MQNFYLFTMVYGQAHVNLFKRACFRSMLYPKNVEVLKDKLWVVYTKREHFDEISNLFKDSPFKLQLVLLEDSMRVAGCGYVKTSMCDGGVILLNGLRNQVAFSLKYNQKMLFAPPDTIFGDGTIPNLIAMGKDAGTVVGVAHARVHDSVLDHLEYIGATSGAPSNAQLVSLLKEHGHASWVNAEIGHENNNSFIGGISWQRLSENLISVQHRLPTPYFLDFRGDDLAFWWSMVSFGALDHTWPGDRLYRQERFRYCGSSDACMILEITGKDNNVPPVVQKEALEIKEADQYFGDRVHHSVNRLFNVIWREG